MKTQCPRAIFWDASADGQGWGRRIAFGEPLCTRRAWKLEDVAGVVAWAEAEARAGRWVTLALSYESAPAFDSALGEPAAAPNAAPGRAPVSPSGAALVSSSASPTARPAASPGDSSAAMPAAMFTASPGDPQHGRFSAPPLAWAASHAEPMPLDALADVSPLDCFSASPNASPANAPWVAAVPACADLSLSTGSSEPSGVPAIFGAPGHAPACAAAANHTQASSAARSAAGACRNEGHQADGCHAEPAAAPDAADNYTQARSAAGCHAGSCHTEAGAAPDAADNYTQASSAAGRRAESPQAGPWRALVPPRLYAERFEQLQQWISQGETYQANYTVPFECSCACSAPGFGLAWFARLARAQSAGFCAWLDLGPREVLSFSPELFFRLQGGGEVLARPMKGTSARGETPAEDLRLREALAKCPKNRAENVMIVDLLRSDLGRVAVPGSVEAARLFHVEAYPTVFQMTSDVRARLRPGVGLWETLAALFPCGSVTGAPKVRTMHLLRRLEPHPRGLYCGALGLLEPSPGPHLRATFSVPIRTIELNRAAAVARFSTGGGVTHDSSVAAEYAELQDKMRFLIPPQEDFELLESLLLLNGRYPLLDGHLARLERSSEHFGFPVDGVELLQALDRLSRANPQGRHKVRLLLARSGALKAESAPIARGRTRVRLGFAPAPVDSRQELLAHKTTRRALYEQALAACPGCDDALLVNERGEVTEATRASLVLFLNGRLVTPSLGCGLLPGVFRERLLEQGTVHEQVLRPADVLRAERVWLVNSVRWWMACEVLGQEGGGLEARA